MKVLNIVEAAYRGTLEEQDDTVVWICTAMKGAKADIDVLLRGNAVNYAVRAQDAGGLSFGGHEQSQPPKIADDMVRLKGQGAKIYVVEDALRERGIEPGELIDGLDLISRSNVAKLFGEYDQVWHW
jgi:sulfur relay (sulfurtransferase) DsrF/TusC family protein